MFTKKDLLFTELKRNLKLFILKFGNKLPGTHTKEYTESLARYKQLVDDVSFQEKLHELSLLETVIIQAYCMDNSIPIVYTNKTAKTPSLYVRGVFPMGSARTITKSVGPRKDFPEFIRILQKDPAFMALAKARLKEAMEQKFIYKAYKLRFPNS